MAIGGVDFDAKFLGQGRRSGSGTQAPMPQPGLGRFPGPIKAFEVVVEDWVGLAAAVHKPIGTPDFRG
jgi:hypothetical protein